MEDELSEQVVDEVLSDLLVHLILPPDCPQKQDGNLVEINSLLLHLIHDSVASFMEQSPDDVKAGCQSVERMMTQWVEIQQKRSIHADKLEETLLALPVDSKLNKLVLMNTKN